MGNYRSGCRNGNWLDFKFWKQKGEPMKTLKGYLQLSVPSNTPLFLTNTKFTSGSATSISLYAFID